LALCAGSGQDLMNWQHAKCKAYVIDRNRVRIAVAKAKSDPSTVWIEGDALHEESWKKVETVDVAYCHMALKHVAGN
jgi:ubiquinone/menaquinone biosynthesis C-methylase UbiE